MNSSKKRYIRINENTATEEIYGLLDAVESDTEETIENLLEDSDTEFYTEEELTIPDSDSRARIVSAASANVHVLSELPQAQINTEPATTSRQNKTTSKQKKLKFVWKSKPDDDDVENPTIELNQRKECTLDGKVQFDFSDDPDAYIDGFEVFDKTCNFNDIVNMIVIETNRYADQEGRLEFQKTDVDEMKAFIGVTFLMSINPLPALHLYWDSDPFIGNEGIKTVMTRDRYKGILKNLHFCNNNTADTSDKGYKIRKIINMLNEAFQSAVSASAAQAIDEHMIKFKG